MNEDYNYAFFRVGVVRQFKYEFVHKGENISKISYFKILEITDKDRHDNPVELKVLELHNYQQFLSGDETNTSIRVFKVRDLEPII